MTIFRRLLWGGAAFGRVAGTRTATTSLPSSASSADLRLSTLGVRADLVSGGDALVRIRVPSGVDPASVELSLNGQDITSSFRQQSDGRGLGLVTGLRFGQNELAATSGSYGAQLTITNHPLGGPVFSGPQIEPWTCSN